MCLTLAIGYSLVRVLINNQIWALQTAAVPMGAIMSETPIIQ